MPDSQAGYFRSFVLRPFLAANNDQDNSSNQRQTAECRRNRNVLLIFPGRVDRPYIQNLFLMGVSESLIRQRQPAKNNQKNSNPDDWFHIDGPAAKPNVSVLESN